MGLNKAHWRFSGPQFVTPTLCSVDPVTTIVTVENLEISTYSFTVVAQTPLGTCGRSSGSISLSMSLLSPSIHQSMSVLLAFEKFTFFFFRLGLTSWCRYTRQNLAIHHPRHALCRHGHPMLHVLDMVSCSTFY